MKKIYVTINDALFSEFLKVNAADQKRSNYSTNGMILSGGFLKQTVHLLILDLVLAGPFRVCGTGLENCSFSSIVANQYE